MSPSFHGARRWRGAFAALFFLPLLPLASGLACSGGGAATPDGGAAGKAGTTGGAAGTAGVSTGGAGAAGTIVEPDAIVGSFDVTIDDGATSGTNTMAATLTGVVADHAHDSSTVNKTIATDGSCTLTKPVVSFCSPACTNMAVCLPDGSCRAPEIPRSVGNVTMTGVKNSADNGTLILVFTNGRYNPPGDIMLSYPPADEGANIALQASGAEDAAFSLQAKGIALLVAPPAALNLVKDTPLAVTWTAAGASADSKIHVKLDISHHAGSKGMIECDSADTGSVTISGALVTQLLDLGVAGFPTIAITRRSVGVTSIERGKVQLQIQQTIERDVTTSGLVSCHTDDDCPTGKTCQIPGLFCQ